MTCSDLPRGRAGSEGRIIVKRDRIEHWTSPRVWTSKSLPARLNADELSFNSTGDDDAGSKERKSRSENVLGLQKSVRVPGVRSWHGARAAIRCAGAMDSVPVAREGQGRAQRLFRVQGQILLYGCASLGETARSVDPRSAESVRHHSCGDRRVIRRHAGPIARLWPAGLQEVLPARVRSRSAGSRGAADCGTWPVRPALSRIS